MAVRRTAIIVAIGSVAVFAAGYVAWRQAVDTAMTGLERARASLAADGVALDWGDARLAGFPFDIHLALDAPSVETTQGWRVTAGWAQARAQGDGVALVFSPEATLDAGAGPMATQLVEATAMLPRQGPASARIEAMTLTGLGGGRVSFSGVSISQAPSPAINIASARLTTPQDNVELFATTLTFTPEIDNGLMLVKSAQRVELRAGGSTLAASGPATLRLGAANGRATAALTAARVRLPETPAPSLQPLEAARVSLTIDAPVEAAPTLQAYGATLDIEGLTPGPAFLEAVQDMAPPTPMALSARLSGEAMVRADLLSGAAADAGLLPARVATLVFDAVSAQGLGAEGTLSGVLVLKPDRSAPDGELLVEIDNWAPALAALQEGGVVSADQAAFALRLIDALGDPTAPSGVFLSRIALRGAQVYANGARVR